MLFFIILSILELYLRLFMKYFLSTFLFLFTLTSLAQYAGLSDARTLAEK